LNLSLGLVHSTFEQRLAIGFVEVRLKNRDPAQVKPTVLEHFEKHRVLS
jgi:hypothetical protein